MERVTGRDANEAETRGQQQRVQTSYQENMKKLEENYQCTELETDETLAAQECCGKPHVQRTRRNRLLVGDLGQQPTLNLEEKYQCEELETGVARASLPTRMEPQAERDEISRLKQTLSKTETQLSVVKREYSRTVLAQDQLKTVKMQCAKAEARASAAEAEAECKRLSAGMGAARLIAGAGRDRSATDRRGSGPWLRQMLSKVDHNSNG